MPGQRHMVELVQGIQGRSVDPCQNSKTRFQKRLGEYENFFTCFSFLGRTHEIKPTGHHAVIKRFPIVIIGAFKGNTELFSNILM